MSFQTLVSRTKLTTLSIISAVKEFQVQQVRDTLVNKTIKKLKSLWMRRSENKKMRIEKKPSKVN